jgi:hypothetical protein
MIFYPPVLSTCSLFELHAIIVYPNLLNGSL